MSIILKLLTSILQQSLMRGLRAAESNIPHTSGRLTTGPSTAQAGMSGLNPFALSLSFGTGCGWNVADYMRRTRARCHYTIRQVKRDEDW